MKKENIWFFIIGFIFTFAPFFIFNYEIYRLIITLVGIIILSISLIINTKNLPLKVVIFPIMVFLFVYLIDYYSFIVLKKPPVMIIEFKSSEKVSTYNSLIYRIYKCDKKLILDKNYKKSYACDRNEIEVKSISEYLGTNLKQTYHSTKNKFVHIKGKISKIIGSSEIEIDYYDSKVGINGYVNFEDNKKIVLKNLNINPKKYHIYDEIEFTGEVTKYIISEDNEEIDLTYVKIYDLDIYKNADLLVNYNYDNKMTNLLDNVYYLGISNIYYKYNEDNIYDLSYILTDKRDSIDNIVKGKEYTENKNNDRVYKFEKFNLVRCNNEKTIFVNPNINIKDNICE